MIVTRVKAKEACEILGWGVETLGEEFTPAGVVAQYKHAAKSAHPDTGGSAEAFARVDWAKHALLAWLRQQGGATEHSVFDRTRCDACNGSGRVTMRKGWSTLQVSCTKCHGSGDADYDVEKVDHGR